MQRGHRYNKMDQISFIQANLKEMKDSVSEFLRKSKNENVGLLRPRHYLILSCMQEIAGGAGDRLGMIKELSSGGLGSTMDGERFEPLREGEKEKNRVVKIKRQANSLNKSTSGEVDCLLPNICQLKLDFEQTATKTPKKTIPEGKTIDIPQEFQRYEMGRDRRYHSIDLNHEFKVSQSLEEQSGGFRVTNKWLSASKSRELIKTLRQKHSWAEEIGEAGQESPFSYRDAPAALDLSKEKMGIQDGKANTRLVYHQRKESILKRRIQANRRLAKDAQHHHKKPIPLKEQLEASNKKIFRFDKGATLPSPSRAPKLRQIQANNSECSPWRDLSPRKEVSLLEGQFF